MGGLLFVGVGCLIGWFELVWCGLVVFVVLF